MNHDMCYKRQNSLNLNWFGFLYKGLQRQCLIGSALAGFNLARTITKASATGLYARQDDYNKGISSPGRLVNNQLR